MASQANEGIAAPDAFPRRPRLPGGGGGSYGGGGGGGSYSGGGGGGGGFRGGGRGGGGQYGGDRQGGQYGALQPHQQGGPPGAGGRGHADQSLLASVGQQGMQYGF